VVIGGGLSWAALLFGGVHPALALVPIVPFMPRINRDPGFLVDAPAAAHDTLNEFERWCRHPAQVALLLFGLVTGGVLLRALDSGTLAMPAAYSSASRWGSLPASRSPARSASISRFTSARAS
jgi:NhaA family Na+:H+ antiporter